MQYRKKQSAIIAAVVGIGIIGSALVFSSHAATTTASVEAEAGTSTAAKLTDSTASASQAVEFAAAASSGTMKNCIVSPHVCGYPDATNTGVPAGTTLLSVPSQATSGTGWVWDSNNEAVKVTTAGAVISGLNVTGAIEVSVNNVTIKNSKVSVCTYYPINYSDTATGLTVQDTEIYGGCTDATACISFDNYTAIRINCNGTVDGFKGNTNVVIQDSYIHDIQANSGTHNDGIQSTGGSNVKFIHNTCDMGTTGDCIQWGSADSGWTVNYNLVRAAGFMFNGGTSTTNSSFTGNRFVNKSVTSAFGYASIPGTGITWNNNYRDDDLSVVTY